MLIERFLEPFCAKFMATSNLADGLYLCGSSKWDVIIVDLRLMDSDTNNTLESIQKIREMQRDAGILVCSGMPVPDLAHKAKIAGADSFIAKSPELYRDDGNALKIAVWVVINHHKTGDRTGSFMQHARLLERAAHAA